MILDNIKKIRYRIETAAKRAGRDPESVRLLVVTKYAGLDAVRQVVESGLVSELGENRVQDAAAKKSALGVLGKTVGWRMIGHLQTNKAAKAAETFDAIDSLDSLKLAATLSAVRPRMPALVQVKLSAKQTQSGVEPEKLEEMLEALKMASTLDVRGLMAIAPELEPVSETRPYFSRMRGLFERFFSGRTDAVLSMGMSRDFELAVEEGATMVRVGSTVFSCPAT